MEMPNGMDEDMDMDGMDMDSGMSMMSDMGDDMMLGDVSGAGEVVEGFAPTVIRGPGGLPIVVPKAVAEGREEMDLGDYSFSDRFY